MTPEQYADAGLGNVSQDVVDALDAAMEKFAINTAQRQAMFLAQCSHESAGFRRTSENLNYSAEGLCRVWSKHFDAATAAKYAHKPEAIANHAYAGRNGNEDEASGDGWRYRGRGYIQLTGRANYRQLETALGEDIIENPDVVAEPRVAAMSAAWFWSYHGLNKLADAGDVAGCTHKINGGLLGLDERKKLYEQALEVLEVL